MITLPSQHRLQQDALTSPLFMNVLPSLQAASKDACTSPLKQAIAHKALYSPGQIEQRVKRAAGSTQKR